MNQETLFAMAALQLLEKNSTPEGKQEISSLLDQDLETKIKPISKEAVITVNTEIKGEFFDKVLDNISKEIATLHPGKEDNGCTYAVALILLSRLPLRQQMSLLEGQKQLITSVILKYLGKDL